VQESLCINWVESIQQFWDDVCPNGYSIVHNYESKGYGNGMRLVLQAILDVGRYLNLDLPGVNITPPAPMQPQQAQLASFIPQAQQPAPMQQNLVHDMQSVLYTQNNAARNAIPTPASISPRSAILKTIKFNVQPPTPAAQYAVVPFVPQSISSNSSTAESITLTSEVPYQGN
jgi:hypothetical protein